MPSKYSYEINLSSDSAAAKLIKLVGTGKKVLEVGCAAGSQSKVLKMEFCCTVIGIEIDADCASEAAKYCKRVIVANIETIDLEQELCGEKFDVVTFADVLEHLYDPAASLQKVAAVLKDNGYIVASIPNIAHASIQFEMMMGNFRYRNIGLLDESHIKFFTLNSINELFVSTGYCIEALDRVICEPSMTEFETKPKTWLDKAVLNYFLFRNKESSTYQYVIKACRVKSDNTSDGLFSTGEKCYTDN